MEYIAGVVLILLICGLGWAIAVINNMNNREIHHDSRKGSFHEISNRRDN
tara:strand:- start:2023 stop:2172 length:150 start_codon:yes stop_codon:yes gene_type:complete